MALANRKSQRGIPKVRGTPLTRVLAKVHVESNGCWRFTGWMNETGYGRIIVAGNRTEYVHRVTYMALVGPVPQGLEIDHLCRNRWCCNPEHLEAVTHKTNMARGWNALKPVCGNGHIRTPDTLVLRKDKRRDYRQCLTCLYERGWGRGRARKVSAADVVMIRALRQSGERLASIAQLFNVSMGYVSRIANGLVLTETEVTA